jgi:hypothetical protein
VKPALTPNPSPNSGRGESLGDEHFLPPFSQNWEKGLGDEGGLHRDEDSLTQQGTIEAIHIATCAGGEMRSMITVLVEAGKGIHGDRYANQAGTFSDWPRDHEFTLVEAEALEAVKTEYGFTLVPGGTRRNITTRGIRLNDLVGKLFQVGGVLCEGTRLCHPCAHLENITGIGGLCRMLAGRGGLRAVVLETGIVTVGDAIAALKQP